MSGYYSQELHQLVENTTPVPPTDYSPVLNAVESNTRPALDAFSRVRTSDPETVFDSTYHYDKSPLLYEEVVVGTGSGTHLPNEACVRMRVSASGDSIIRQSRQYIRYQPGKSQLVLLTFDAGTARTNTRQRIGLFDANNGVFVQRSGAAVSLVRRTHTGGSPSDASAAAQADQPTDEQDATYATEDRADDLQPGHVLIATDPVTRNAEFPFAEAVEDHQHPRQVRRLGAAIKVRVAHPIRAVSWRQPTNILCGSGNAVIAHHAALLTQRPRASSSARRTARSSAIISSASSRCRRYRSRFEAPTARSDSGRQ
jgi:hypothetical protein